MTETIDFPGHVGYAQQAKNSRIITVEHHSCKYWHAEVCEKIESSNEPRKYRAAVNSDGSIGLRGPRVRSTLVVGTEYTVPVCDCACHWIEVKASTPIELPKKSKKQKGRNGKHNK